MTTISLEENYNKPNGFLCGRYNERIVPHKSHLKRELNWTTWVFKLHYDLINVRG
jgi:hypothetical protein